MDRLRQHSDKPKSRTVWFVSLAALVVIGLVVILSTLDFGTKRVDGALLQIDTVQRGNLDIKVSANGVLLPKDVEWITSQEEGRIIAIHKRAGDHVEAGQVLVELSNPALVNAAEEALSALEGGKAEKLAYSVELQNQLLNQKSITLQAKFAHESAKLKLNAETELRKRTSIIADIDYRRTQLSVEQLHASHLIEQERLEKRQVNIATQLAAKDAQVNQLAKVLNRRNANASALRITAGMTGVLQEMNLKIGQRVPAGSVIAHVARQDKFYAQLKVLARQASEIAAGQKAVIDTRNGTIEGVVSRIDPAVTGGTVVVDIELTSSLPKAVRPELQVEGIIYIAQLRDTLYVGKPNYGKTNSTVSVYRMDEKNHYAERTLVDMGRASLNHIEVLKGLKLGDQIILSDSTDWQEHARIIVN